MQGGKARKTVEEWNAKKNSINLKEGRKGRTE